MKKLITKLLDDFHGCDIDRRINIGTSSTTITPTRNGYLVVAGSSTVSSGAAPVIRIQTAGGTIYSEGIGVVSSGAILSTGCPVRKGVTYTVAVYRCTFSSANLFY